MDIAIPGGYASFCVMTIRTGEKLYEGRSEGAVASKLGKHGTCYGWGPDKLKAYWNCEARRKKFIEDGHTGAPLVPKFPMPVREK